MRALQSWWGHVRALTTRAARTWWATLPGVSAALGVGFVVHRALLVAAAAIWAEHPWLALVVLSSGFTALLAGYLVALRLVGSHLGVGRQLAALGEDEDSSSQPLSRLLAVTLLPFLAIYAVFGKVQELSGQLILRKVVLRGFLAPGVLATVNPQTSRERLVVLGVLVAAYLLRRLLDLFHERTGWRVLGLLTALVETFFLLVLIYGGARLLNRCRAWLEERAVHRLWETALGWAADVLRLIHVSLPHWLEVAWHTLTGPIWSWAAAGLFEPMLWLALAGLAFGSQVMSMSRLVRETLGQRPGQLARLPLPAGQAPPGGCWVSCVTCSSATSTTSTPPPSSRCGLPPPAAWSWWAPSACCTR